MCFPTVKPCVSVSTGSISIWDRFGNDFTAVHPIEHPTCATYAPMISAFSEAVPLSCPGAQPRRYSTLLFQLQMQHCRLASRHRTRVGDETS